MSWICPCGTSCPSIRCEKCGQWEWGKDHKIKTLEDYLFMKAKERDWHAVSDAANDLRVLEGK
jgi:hypothetical protein